MSPAFYRLLLAGAFTGAIVFVPQRSSGELAPRVRRPGALICIDQGKTLLVANRRSGSLSIIEVATRRAVAEHDVGRALSDLAALRGERRLLAADGIANELLLLEYHDREVRVVDRLGISPDPVCVITLGHSASWAAASRWSRRLTFGSITNGPAGEDGALASIASIDLPFCPGAIISSGDGSKLVVADAFGGGLAVVDARRHVIELVRSIPAHNIRGMAFSPGGESLVIAHQYLNHLAQTTFDDVHWGSLIRNHLRSFEPMHCLQTGLITHCSTAAGCSTWVMWATRLVTRAQSHSPAVAI